MAVRKITSSDGLRTNYSVHFGDYYVGSFPNFLEIANEWLGLIVREPSPEYLEKLDKFNTKLQVSFTPKTNFMAGVDVGTFHIFNLIWFFGYRPRLTPKEVMVSNINNFEINAVESIIDIMRPHKRPLPELDEIKTEKQFTFIETELGKPLNPQEKREYRKNLKQYKEYMMWYNEMSRVIQMQLKVMNIKFTPNQMGEVESNIQDIQNQLRQINTELATIHTRVSGKKTDFDTS